MEWFRERHDLLVLNRIRDAFKNQYYGTIEIWRLFGANVTLNIWEFYRGNTYSNKNIFYFFYFFILKDFVYYFKHKKKLKNIEINSKPFIVEAISDERRISGFWLPVAEKFSKDEVLLLTENVDVYLKNNSKFNVYFLIEFSLFEWLTSRFYIIHFILKNFRFLFFNKSLFSPLTSFHIINIITLQISSVIKFKYLIRKYHPKGFLTFWDWYDLGSAGTSVFKSKGLPTFTFIHGAAGKESLKEFIPLNADYIFSWGKYHTESLCELGISRSKILQCGCPRMDGFKNNILERKEAYNSSILILLTAVIDPCFVNDIVYIVNHYSKEHTIYIRLHPSTKQNNLDKKLQSLNIHFLTSDIESIETSISKSDIIIVDTSTAGFDAINMDKPVFVIDSAPVKRPQDIMEDIINYGAAIFCDSFAELERDFHRYKSDSEFRNRLLINRRRFVNDFICDYGNQATKNMFEKIDIITNS